jgi:hypothetical protein
MESASEHYPVAKRVNGDSATAGRFAGRCLALEAIEIIDEISFTTR